MVLELVYLEGRSVQEAAELLGMEQNQCESAIVQGPNETGESSSATLKEQGRKAQ